MGNLNLEGTCEKINMRETIFFKKIEERNLKR